MIKSLSGWSEHTAGTAGTVMTGKCQKFGENCPFMGTMPPLVKIGMTTENDDTEGEEYAYNNDDGDNYVAEEIDYNIDNDGNDEDDVNDNNNATQGKPCCCNIL